MHACSLVSLRSLLVAALAVVALAVLATDAAAGRVEVDLTGLPSTPLAMGDRIDIDVTLPVAFSRIDSVRVIASGEHQLGSAYDLNDPVRFPVSALLSASLVEDGQVAARSRGTFLPDSPGFADVLATIDRDPFGRRGSPDYGVLADRETTVRLSSDGLLFIGTTVIESLPVITIASAKLVVEGVVVPEPSAALLLLLSPLARRRVA